MDWEKREQRKRDKILAAKGFKPYPVIDKSKKSTTKPWPLKRVPATLQNILKCIS